MVIAEALAGAAEGVAAAVAAAAAAAAAFFGVLKKFEFDRLIDRSTLSIYRFAPAVAAVPRRAGSEPLPALFFAALLFDALLGFVGLRFSN